MAQLETPRGLLSRQADLPKLALANTPLSALGEGLSGILSSVAGALPDVPAPPGAAAVQLPRAGALGLPRFSSLFSSIEASFPAGIPKVSQVVQSLEGGGGNAQAGPVIGGGFRSVAGKTVKVLGGGYRSI